MGDSRDIHSVLGITRWNMSMTMKTISRAPVAPAAVPRSFVNCEMKSATPPMTMQMSDRSRPHSSPSTNVMSALKAMPPRYAMTPEMRPMRSRATLLADGGLLVVAQEDVLEARLDAGQRNDLVAGGHLDHRVGGALHRDAQDVAFVQVLHLGDAIKPGELLDRHGLAEDDCQLDALHVPEVAHARDLDQPALADDADSGAGLLDLAEHMGRKEHCASRLARLLDHGLELLLVERIEAARRLVEDEDLGAVHEGLDEHHLAFGACRVLDRKSVV